MVQGNLPSETGARRSDAVAAPWTRDDLLSRENVPASEPVPAAVAARLAEQSVQVSTGDKERPIKPQDLVLQAETASTVRITLPKHAHVGCSVASYRRLQPGACSKTGEETDDVPGSRPAWVPGIFHPKVAMGSPRQLLRARSGRSVTPTAIYDGESRKPFFPGGYPWHCIGRLFVWRDANAANWSKSGTATLIGPRVVLTASHLLPFGAPDGTSKILFVPGYFDGSSTAGAGAASWVTEASGYTFEPDDQAFDMAVLRLNDPVGEWLGYMGARTYVTDWEDKPFWEMVGYPGDVAKAERPSFEVGISVLDDDSDGDFLEIEHHGDSSDGNSGGPLFSFWPNGPYVIGVLSGLERRTGLDAEDANVSAGGKGMVDLVRWARATWT